MARYIVRFFKDVIGKKGHTCEICQAAVELDARNDRDAEEKAKRKFCEIHAIQDWSLHADRFKADPADFPS